MAQTSGYPIRLEADYPEKSSRGLALLAILIFIKALLLIPHLIAIFFLWIAMFVVAVIGYWVVLITGKYPKGMYNFVLGVTRWQMRNYLWLFGLTDKYPPFSLS